MLALPNVSTTASPPVPLFHARELPRPSRALLMGELVSVRRGIYAPAPAWHALAPWDRYLARVFAVAMTHPEAVFSHESAAALEGLPILGDPLVVHVLARRGETARLDSGIRTHTAADERELHETGGILRTSPREIAVDLARARHPAYALSIADAALRGDHALSVETLVAANESRSTTRGRRLARWPLHRAVGTSESTLESLSRAVIEWLGFPEPELQKWFESANGTRDRADFAWPRTGVIGESDGDVKYDGTFGDPLSLIRDRRARDARLREHARTVVHWSWDDIGDPPRFARILLSAGLKQVGPEATAQLFSLRRLLHARPQ